MGKVTGFKEYSREIPARRPVQERVQDYFEVYLPFPEEKVRVQADVSIQTAMLRADIPLGIEGLSADGDLLVVMVMGLLTLLLLLVPFIPGLRDIPRWIPIYRLIWRRYYAETKATAR